MALSESPQRVALREFGETVCAACGATKQARQSFCRACYFSLSDDMRKALYRRFGSGYEEAYDDAKDWLKQEKNAGK